MLVTNTVTTMSVITLLILLISKLKLLQLSIAHLKLSNVVICVIIYHGATRDQSYSIKSKYDDKVIQTNPLERVIIVTPLDMTEVLRIVFHLTPPTLRVTG